jgi:hypothetical protein
VKSKIADLEEVQLSDPTKKAEIKDNLANMKRLPRNTIENAANMFEKHTKRHSHISQDDVLKQLRARKENIETWNNIVLENYDTAFEAAVNDLNQTTTNGQESTDNKGDGDGDDDDDDDVEGGTDDESKCLRTCTASFKQILRPELLGVESFKRIVSIAETRQKTITAAMEEVSVLARKTVYLVGLYHVYHVILFLVFKAHSTYHQKIPVVLRLQVAKYTMAAMGI